MKRPLFVGALAILAAGTAFAGDPVNTTAAADPTATFKSLDTDGDGRISAVEARKHDGLNAGYRSAVSDSDKGMSMEEFDAWVASRGPGSMTPKSPTSQPVEVPPKN